MHDTAPIGAGKTPREQFTIILVDAAHDQDSVFSRIKQLLKTTLRAYRLRCIECRTSDGKAVEE